MYILFFIPWKGFRISRTKEQGPESANPIRNLTDDKRREIYWGFGKNL